MRRQVAIALCFTFWYCNAQVNHSTTNGDLALRVNANGILAIDLTDLSPSSEFKTTGNHFLSEAGIWLSARDVDQKLYINSQLSTAVGEYDFAAGPLDTFTGNPADGDWNAIWSVTKYEIDNHKANFANSNYMVPASIANWPAVGGEDLIMYLAPFVDYNNNGIYDPENGDYPHIKGTIAWYCIFNDNAGEHKVSKGAPLGIEVHLMVYRLDEMPKNTFLEYYLINRSDVDYEDVRLGFMLGGENGNSSDNYFGSSATENAVFIYNGDSVDAGNFEDNLPYVYCKFLNQPLSAAIQYSNSSNAINGKPTNAAEFDNYLNAKWRDGSALVQGGNGQGAGSATSFLFNSDEDWTEESESQLEGSRNALAIAEFPTLKQKEFISIELALGYGFYGNSDNVHNLLKSDFESLSEFTWVPIHPNLNVMQYPNPFRSSFVLEVVEAGEYEIKVTDIQGLSHYSEKKWINQKIRCNIMLNPGVYVLELNRNGRTYKKLINVQP